MMNSDLLQQVQSLRFRAKAYINGTHNVGDALALAADVVTVLSAVQVVLEQPPDGWCDQLARMAETYRKRAERLEQALYLRDLA